MQDKFLKQIIEKVVGISGSQIVDLLSDKKNVNEFLIAKRLELTINQTRNLLYKLSHTGILSSIRKKDKRKGWYIYFWTLNRLKSLEILEEKLEEELVELKKEYKKRSQQRFYKCNLCGVEVIEEEAMLTDFVCSECGEVYKLANSEVYVKEMEKRISKIEKDLKLIRGELSEEKNKEDKKLSRLINKKEKEKKETRKREREKRAKEKKKLEKKEMKGAGSKAKIKKVKKKKVKKKTKKKNSNKHKTKKIKNKK